MPKPNRIAIGQRFGRLVVLKRDDRNPHPRTKFICRCDCDGKTLSVFNFNLINENTLSCGCLQRDRAAAAHLTHGESRRRSTNSSPSREYSTWCSMMQRCLNPNNSAYDRYGGRGIKICNRWMNNYDNFLTDILAEIGRCPPGQSFDRYPDKNGDYKPGNVRWATPKKQAINTRHIDRSQIKQTQIIAVLEKHRRPMALKDIVSATGQGRTNVRRLLRMMIATDELIRTQIGYYALPAGH